MAWTWIRPRDASLLDGRPLLDLGAGDGQTRRALVRPHGLVVGLDRRAGARGIDADLAGDAGSLPFAGGSFSVVLAADLFHHVADLPHVLGEVARVLAPGGSLVAWWYGAAGRPAPDAPRHPRPQAEVAEAALDAGFASAGELELEVSLDGGPGTVGLLATVEA